MTVVHLLVSPGARKGRSSAVPVVTSTLRAEGVEVVDITGPDADPALDSARAAALDSARAAVADGAERLIAAGGDGTVHLALQAVAGTGVVLGVVPLGTGNDFAGALGLNPDPAAAARAALGPPIPHDAIRVGGRWVASVATAGFSGDVNARANAMRFPTGASRYTCATVAELAGLAHRSISLTVDGVRHNHTAALVAVANTSDFGGGMRICPEADAGDGVLEVTVLGDVGRLELLRCLRLVFSGRHLSHPLVYAYRGATVELACDDPLALWGDGEPLDTASPNEPVTLAAVPGAIDLATG